MGIGGVILAAGLGSRMQGKTKQLLPFKGKPFIAHTVQTALNCTQGREWHSAERGQSEDEYLLNGCVLVLGHEAENIQAVISDMVKGACARGNFAVCVNKDYRQGQGTSLAAGLGACQKLFAAMNEPLDGVLVLQGDQILVQSATILTLLAAFMQKNENICAIRPKYNGIAGNPVLLGAELFGEIAALHEDIGARDILKRHAQNVCFVPVDDEGVLRDIDTQEEYAQLLQEIAQNAC